jgi:SEC-C motif domain protein
MPPDTARIVMTCPCASSEALSFDECCGRYVTGAQHLQAPTAQALMRSRYSAYVLNELSYLLSTWHASTRPATLSPNEPGLKWLGLEIKNHQVIDATHATVEFVARSKLGGRAHRLHEISRFVWEEGRWYYLDGNIFR